MKKKYISLVLSSLLLTSCANSFTRLVNDGKKVEMSGYSNEITQEECLNEMNSLAGVFDNIEDILTYTKEDKYEFESEEYIFDKEVQYNEEKTTKKKTCKYDHETYRLTKKYEYGNFEEINYNGQNESYFYETHQDYYLQWKEGKLYILDKVSGYNDEMDDENRDNFEAYFWIIDALVTEIDSANDVVSFLSLFIANEVDGNVVKYYLENNVITITSTYEIVKEDEFANKKYTRNNIVQMEVANEGSTIYFRTNVEETLSATYKQDIYDICNTVNYYSHGYGFRAGETYNYKYNYYYSGMVSALLFDEITNFPVLGE